MATLVKLRTVWSCLCVMWRYAYCCWRLRQKTSVSERYTNLHTTHAITNATHDFPIIPNYVNHSCETRRFDAAILCPVADTSAAVFELAKHTKEIMLERLAERKTHTRKRTWQPTPFEDCFFYFMRQMNYILPLTHLLNPIEL
ncbi:unnamed protein product [Ceratitis capitata]|uniref:(Mediterranean fruit fly) hypothetical protein n=1 Tax=Ceratitis capitata TaxID=7213 RepID=A0A811V173_CERCA|nr:unnamed protein product [Ceratitis capitata]